MLQNIPNKYSYYCEDEVYTTHPNTHTHPHTYTCIYPSIYTMSTCVGEREELPTTLKLTNKVNKFIAILYEYYIYIHTIHIHIYIYINTFDYSNGYCNHEIQVTINELMIDTKNNNNNKCFTQSVANSLRTISRASTWKIAENRAGGL